MKEELGKKRVCIIGAGPAGLVAIRHISQSTELVGTVFEAKEDLGGVWLYRRKYQNGTYEALYKHMRTNLPKQLMSFPDFLYPEAFSTNPKNSSSFLHHTEVLQYLNSYADHFQLRKFIQFRHRVTNVRPVVDDIAANSSSPKWRVTVTHVEDTKNLVLEEEIEFDIVLVCNGHLSKPRMATIPNLEKFVGTVIHSRSYDDPVPFNGKRVLVIGCGPSGVDISLEVAAVATEVYISTRQKLNFQLPSNMKEVARIKFAAEESFHSESGEIVYPDAVIMCTGYVVDMPFLSPECNLVVEESLRISPLYRDLVHIHYNTLCFVGIQVMIIPFLLFDFQIQYLLKLFEACFDLPSKEVMIAEMTSQRLFRMSLSPLLRLSHALEDRQWDYYESLAEEAKFSLPFFIPLLKKVYVLTKIRRAENARDYKNDFIRITDFQAQSLSYIESPNSYSK